MSLCLICSSALLIDGSLSPTAAHPGRKFTQCDNCRSIQLAAASGAPTANQTAGRRLGSAKRFGRDYAMAMMGKAILGTANIDLHWWQPGVSEDRKRIAAIPGITSITELPLAVEGPGGPDSVHTEGPTADLLIGNEVVQCLKDPVEDLSNALRRIRTDGLAILSTDLNMGDNPDRMKFLRQRPHTMMWSFEALTYVAQRDGFTVDCRLPMTAVDRSLTRKRYVLMTRSADVRRRIRRYFGHVAFAPSEPAT